ncbi:type IV secretion core protein [Pseudomonas phage Dolphis]|nr:type IV secretion core protein [Pseudomonas phage Dolphis]
MWLVGLGAIVALAGCAGRQEPVERVVTVQVAVKEPCIEKAPTRPAYRYGKGAWPEGTVAAKILADDFEKAEQYGHDWEAAAAGCLVVPAAKP